MADNNDYQLEEMENSAVNKSTMAKRAAMGAGLLAAGAATAYGADQLINDGDNVATEPEQQQDLTSGAAAGAVEGGVTDPTAAQTQQSEPQTVHTEEDVHVYHHYPEPQPEPEPEMEFESTSHLYDDDGNLIATVDAGTYDGKTFAVIDADNDNHGDVLWYDENNDGVIQDNELVDVTDANYSMGSHGGVHQDYNIETGEEIAHNPTPYEPAPYDPDPVKYDPIADIDNDYDDIAQNNPDYNNHGDVDYYDQYSADLNSNDSHDDSTIGEYDVNAPEEETLYAEEDTLEDNNTDEYALSDENSSEETDDSEMAYDSDEYAAEDSADEDMAYTDDIQNDAADDSVDDTAQYDIV